MEHAAALLGAFRTGRQSIKLAKAIKKARPDGEDAILSAISPALDAMETDVETAGALIWVLDNGALSPDTVADIFQRILDAHGDQMAILMAMGDAIEAARDIDDLNAPAPTQGLFAEFLSKLSERQLRTTDPKDERDLADAMATTARLMARQKDSIAERAYLRLAELEPDNPYSHYGLGLFYKTRGRFRDGMIANQRAIEIAGDGGTEAMQWNLGICATGAGEGQIALDIWRTQGNNLDIGLFDLPMGGYPACKVRLSQNPLAERTADNDHPGPEESIWVRRLSPCHGIVENVLYQDDLGVDYGDTVLFDGAPITYHRYGDNEVAVFPHLATLQKGGFQYFPFAATQLTSGVVDTVNDQLDNTALIYSHTENCYSFCAACMADDTKDHSHDTQEHTVIHGRIAMSSDTTPTQLLAKIDTAYADIEGARLFAPDLVRAAGNPDRARLEDQRYYTLTESD